MVDCRFKGSCNMKDCPSPYCLFSNEENADKIFDIIDDYVDLKESILNEKTG